MKLFLCSLSFILMVPFAAWSDTCSFPGKTGEWFGFVQHDFKVDGHKARVVCPDESADGKPWIWRARFWGHEPQTDLALLRRGFHVAYMEVGNLFGNSEAVERWDAFYAEVTLKHGFSTKPALEGMSRGGLIIFNWAIANPEKVACIYGDAPVMDFKSWPGGKGIGKGSPGDWKTCKKVYGLSEEEAMGYAGNPVDRMAPLAKAKVPLLHVIGTKDEPVPHTENTALAEKRYKALGGEIQVIAKEGGGHHPHSLVNPTPIVEFVLQHTGFASPENTAMRGGIRNSGAIFTQTKKGRVAFLGGSITEMNGWRALTYKALEERFPDTKFDFVHAGLASTDSTMASFRLEQDVFGQGPVDLLFMDHSVNDNHNMRDQQQRIRAVEGIIRHARALNPNIDIIVQYFAEPANMAFYAKGEESPIIVDHDRVTQYYDVTAINLAKQVHEDVASEKYSWDKDFKDLHPSAFGHEVYVKKIGEVFDASWRKEALAKVEVKPHWMPEAPLDALNYERGRYVDVQTAEVVTGWQYYDSWKASDGAGTRRQFQHVPTLEALKPGAAFAFDFEGTAVGLRVVAGPDVGMLEYSIDGEAYEPLDQFTPWSERLHIPWAYMLATDLKPGGHRLELRISDKKNEKSTGHAARIQEFLVN